MGTGGYNSTTFGKLLLSLREAAELSQETLAERAGLSRDAISALERGRRQFPHPQTVQSLITALSLSPEDAQLLQECAPRPRRARYAEASERTSSNLPIPVTGLVGRTREMIELRTLITDGTARLITLTGPAGVGKTKLAVHLTREMSEEFPGAIVFVPLASIHDESLVLPTITQSLGIRGQDGASLVQQMQHALRNRPTLLVLDNLEHLRGAFPEIAELVAGSPGLRVLATSRTPMRISSEQEYPVSPLGVPGSNPDDINENDAVRLFVQRAQMIRPGFAITGANAAAVAEICIQLDGLPLAIELAAARINVLTPEAMLDRLSSRLDLLSGGPRDQAPRLQSIRGALAWSFDLMESWERTLYCGLSIFAESFALDAIEFIMERVSTAHGGQAVLDGMATLVDMSLVRSVPTDGPEPRFGMLGTIRDFGRERLAESGEYDAVCAAHAEWFMRLAERAYLAFRHRADHETWLDRLETDRANIRDALTWFLESGDQTALARLAGFLYWFWDIRGPLSEGRTWLERALSGDPNAIAGGIRFQAMLAAGQVAHFQGDDVAAKAWSEQAFTATPETADPWMRATPLMLLGLIAEDSGDYELAEVRFQDALTLFREADDPFNSALAIHHLGVTAWGRGDVKRAADLCETALDEQRRLRDTLHMSNSLGYLGLIAIGDRRYADAARFLRESLAIRQRSGAIDDLASSVLDFGVLASATNRNTLASRLFGVARRMRWDNSNFVLNLPERAVFESAEQAARQALSDHEFDRLFASAATMSVDQAIAEAIFLADEIEFDSQNGGDTETGEM